jgi:hypothetical protein
LEERARAEELGDVLAEGIFGLLDDGEVIARADKAYWHAFLEERRRFIDLTLDRACDGRIEDEDLRVRMVRSLNAARDQLTRYVTAELCVEYLDAWRQDLESWSTFLDDLGRQRSIGAAVKKLGLTFRTRPARLSGSLAAVPWPASRGKDWLSKAWRLERPSGRQLLPGVVATLLSFFS